MFNLWILHTHATQLTSFKSLQIVSLSFGPGLLWSALLYIPVFILLMQNAGVLLAHSYSQPDITSTLSWRSLRITLWPTQFSFFTFQYLYFLNRFYNSVKVTWFSASSFCPSLSLLVQHLLRNIFALHCSEQV